MYRYVYQNGTYWFTIGTSSFQLVHHHNNDDDDDNDNNDDNNDDDDDDKPQGLHVLPGLMTKRAY